MNSILDSIRVTSATSAGHLLLRVWRSANMKNVPAVIPDVETLAKFSDFCAPIFAQQRILEEQNQSLATLRDNLLPKLMSGEIDVSAVQL